MPISIEAVLTFLSLLWLFVFLIFYLDNNYSVVETVLYSIALVTLSSGIMIGVVLAVSWVNSLTF